MPEEQSHPTAVFNADDPAKLHSVLRTGQEFDARIFHKEPCVWCGGALTWRLHYPYMAAMCGPCGLSYVATLQRVAVSITHCTNPPWSLERWRRDHRGWRVVR